MYTRLLKMTPNYVSKFIITPSNSQLFQLLDIVKEVINCCYGAGAE